MERVVTIVGGGLSGLSLGIGLRRSGAPVVLHEAGVYPRHRVCGEFICGTSPGTLRRLGIEELFADATKHCSTAWFFRGRRILRASLPEGVGISRFALDERLSKKFREMGGLLHERSREKLTPADGLVWCAGRTAAKGRWIGLKCHMFGLELTADLEMHLASNGYVGLARVEQGRINVCGLFRQAPGHSAKGVEIFEKYLRAGGLGHLADRISSARADERSFLGVAGFRLGRQKFQEGVAVLGDAWGMIPPFTGNGMSMAFESAELAGELLRDWQAGKISWQETVRQLRGRQERRFRRRMFWARLMHPFLTTLPGQAFFTVVSRSGLLPFQSCFRILR